MQKLVTIYLNVVKVKHGKIEEHLAEYLANAWKIISIAAADGASGYELTSAFVVILVEKDDVKDQKDKTLSLRLERQKTTATIAGCRQWAIGPNSFTERYRFLWFPG